VHAGRGEAGPFALYAAASAVATAAVVGLSTGVIRRIHRGELDLGEGSVAAGRSARMRFSGPLGTLLEKDLRVAWREPALKASLFMGLISPLLFLFFLTQASGGLGPRSVLGLAMVMGVSVFGTNTFGLERRGIALLMGFPVDRWRILVAKNIASATMRAPSVLTVLLASAFLAPALLPAAATIALVGLVLSAGVDNYASILIPFPAPEPGRGPGAAGGRGLGTMAISAVLLVAALVAASPFVFLAWLPLLLGRAELWALTLPLALAGAAALYAMLVAGAAELLARREPEMLERILWSPA
jgi:ABC-2 type transport system permease protein